MFIGLYIINTGRVTDKHFQYIWNSKLVGNPTTQGIIEQQARINNISFLKIQLAEKSPPPLFCISIRDQACVTQVEYPRSPYYKSILRFLLSKYLLQITNIVNFSKYSHIQNYTTQDHDAYGRPIGSPTTIHTNISAITVTLLPKQL